MGQILYPPEYIELTNPVIFLAGPIQGAFNWQQQAIKIITDLDEKIDIANPRRGIKTKGDFTDDMYKQQVDWEHHYLHRASNYGAILFWLAKEAEHLPERAYAQTTRFELGEHVAQHYLKGIKLVVGIEKGFSGAKYLKLTLGKKAPKMPIIENDLTAACKKAIELAKS